MSRRRAESDPERLRLVDPTDTTGLPMFDARASVEAGMTSLRETAAKHEASIQQLVPLAQELARQAAPSGITVSNLRLAAVARGYLTGSERGRELSWLGAVLARAGLEPTPEFRRSSVVKSHGNPHRVFRLRSDTFPGGDAA